MASRHIAVVVISALISIGGPLAVGGLAETERDSYVAPPTYPAWFVNPPSGSPDSLLWATGCTRAYGTLEQGTPESRHEAYTNAREAYQHVLTGERLYESRPGHTPVSRGQRFARSEYPDTLTAVTYRDSAQTAGMTLTLASWDPRDANPPIDTSAVTFSKIPPSWTNASDVGPNRAVGISTMYYRECQAWQEATEKAYEQLAIETTANVQAMHRSIKGRRHEVYRIRTAVRVHRARVADRWSDGRYAYVLLQANVEALNID